MSPAMAADERTHLLPRSNQNDPKKTIVCVEYPSPTSAPQSSSSFLTPPRAYLGHSIRYEEPEELADNSQMGYRYPCIVLRLERPHVLRHGRSRHASDVSRVGLDV